MKNAMRVYRDSLMEMLDAILDTQSGAIGSAAEALANCILSGASAFAYGAGHAGIFAQELFYRAGGLAVVNPLLPAGTMLSTRPVTLTSDLECLPGYGRAILDASPAKAGDLLLLHSMAARNPVTIEMSILARERGIRTVAVVNMAHASRVASRDPSGKKLYETADIVIDACGCFGDACVEMEGLPGKIAPTSTVACAFIANALTIETCRILLTRGAEPPVLMSANTDGGRAYNDQVLSRYADRIHYMK